MNGVQRGRNRGAGLSGAVLLLVLALLAAGSAAAQVFDYSRLLATPAEEAPAAAAEPAEAGQSRPVSRFDPASVPSGEDYGALTGKIADGDGVLIAAGDAVDVFRARLVELLLKATEVPGELLTVLEAASPTGKPLYFLGVAIFAALLLTIGRGITSLYAVYIARPIFVGLQIESPQGYSGRMPVLLLRVALTLIGSALTVGVAAAVGLFFYERHPPTLVTVIVIFASWAVLMIVDVIWRMMLAPFLPEYRLPEIGDRAALSLYRWLGQASGFAVVSIAFCYWTQALGAPQQVHALATIVLGLVTAVFLIVALRANREAIRQIILAGRDRTEASWMTLLAARLWLPLAAVYLLASWGRMSFELVMGLEASALGVVVPYAVFVAGVGIYSGTCWAIERVFERSRRIRDANRAAETRRRAETEARLADRDGPMAPSQVSAAEGGQGGHDGDDETGSATPHMAPETPPAETLPPIRGQMRSMEDLARRVASLFAIGAGAYALVYWWGGAEIFGENRLLGTAEDLIDVIFLGYILFHAVRIWIDNRIEEEGGDVVADGPLDGEGGGTGASRLATLLPLVRNFVLTLITISVTLIVAMEAGINVAPLFAGAGIIGLAIGFGSQTLVRDVLSGAFFLLDDAFRKGEYLDVGDAKGTVERISLRSFQLRHHLGMLHTIPFGEIKFLTNFSRDWVMMKLPLRLTYDTDVERVRKLVKKLGQSLLEDPVVGHLFMQPLKSQGVIQMEDSAMIIRVKFMTRPGDQWVVRKRVYQEIRDLFDREGIRFAHREVTVRIPEIQGSAGGEDGRPPSGRPDAGVLGAAARTAVDLVDEEQRLAAVGAGPARMDDR